MKNIFSLIIQLLFISVINAQTTQFTTTKVNLRTGPGISYKTLTSIPAGTNITATGDIIYKDWLKVNYKNNTGYINSRYVRKETPTSTISKGKKTSAVKYYKNRSGVRVQSPTVYNSAPAGATARCRDGTYSFSRSRRGTCSHHGGVAKWL